MTGSDLLRCTVVFLIFFFNDTATTEIYTLSLHDALPISPRCLRNGPPGAQATAMMRRMMAATIFSRDRKSTRLNSSHTVISYAVFCLKKKKRRHAAEIIRLVDFALSLLSIRPADLERLVV